MPYFWLLPDANRNRNYRVSGDYIFCSITAFLAFLACIGGIVFLLIGSHDKKVTKNLDANIDFKKLSEPCTIVGYVSKLKSTFDILIFNVRRAFISSNMHRNTSKASKKAKVNLKRNVQMFLNSIL